MRTHCSAINPTNNPPWNLLNFPEGTPNRQHRASVSDDKNHPAMDNHLSPGSGNLNGGYATWQGYRLEPTVGKKLGGLRALVACSNE